MRWHKKRRRNNLLFFLFVFCLFGDDKVLTYHFCHVRAISFSYSLNKFKPSFWIYGSSSTFFPLERLLSSLSLMKIANDKNNYILATKTFHSTISWLFFIIIVIWFFILFWKMGSTEIAQMRFVFLLNYIWIIENLIYFIKFFGWLTSIVSLFAYFIIMKRSCSSIFEILCTTRISYVINNFSFGIHKGNRATPVIL